jgi:hypothetical protein
MFGQKIERALRSGSGSASGSGSGIAGTGNACAWAGFGEALVTGLGCATGFFGLAWLLGAFLTTPGETGGSALAAWAASGLVGSFGSFFIARF